MWLQGSSLKLNISINLQSLLNKTGISDSTETFSYSKLFKNFFPRTWYSWLVAFRWDVSQPSPRPLHSRGRPCCISRGKDDSLRSIKHTFKRLLYYNRASVVLRVWGQRGGGIAGRGKVGKWDRRAWRRWCNGIQGWGEGGEVGKQGMGEVTQWDRRKMNGGEVG